MEDRSHVDDDDDTNATKNSTSQVIRMGRSGESSAVLVHVGRSNSDYKSNSGDEYKDDQSEGGSHIDVILPWGSGSLASSSDDSNQTNQTPSTVDDMDKMECQSFSNVSRREETASLTCEEDTSEGREDTSEGNETSLPGEWDQFNDIEVQQTPETITQERTAREKELRNKAVGITYEKKIYHEPLSKYNPDEGDGGSTLFANEVIAWDPESLAVVEKCYVKMVVACVFIALVSPLCTRYLMTTMATEDEHREDGGSLALDINPSGRWCQDFTPVELALVFVAVMGQFANIVKWMTIFSGYPNSPMNGLNVELEGHAVIGTCTPILGENDAVFLRSLIGRHSAAFHTVAGRHNIEGLYVDIFANEQRSRTGGNVRQNQWCAWVEFLRFLSELRMEDMTWYENPLRKKGSGFFDDDPIVSRHSSELQKLVKIGSTQSLLSVKSFSQDDLDSLPTKLHDLEKSFKEWNPEDIRKAQVPYASTRCIRTSKGDRVMYDLASDFAFHGVQMRPIPGVDRNYLTHGSNEFEPLDHKSRESSPSYTSDDQSINILEMLPMLAFLDNWLDRVKANDANRNNNNNREALEDIFNSAPCTRFFSGAIQVSVQNRLRALHDVFSRERWHDTDTSKFINLTGELMSHETLCYRDEVTEAVVKIKRGGMKDWDLVFSFVSRGKLVKGTTEDEDTKFILDKTEIIKGSIVYYDQEDLTDWFHARKFGTYKVTKVHDSETVDMVRWPMPQSDIENDVESNTTNMPSGVTEVQKKHLHLFCGQRGKAGALHFAMDYLRKRGHEWASTLETPPINRVKTIFSVIDARHMITEPHVYFNNALPHFSRGRNGEDIKGYAPSQDVYLVQYPQYYADVKDNVWNGRNLIHWTVSQFVQDYARCCVSTGSNSLWDISPKGFDFLPLAASCRVDDTAATLSHIKEKIIVHMPVFCSMGVSRPRVGDMLDTWTRWAAGNVELSWILITSKYVREYGFCHCMYMLYLAANFLPSSLAYVSWLAVIFSVYLYSFKEKADGRVPFRDVSAIFKYWECATFSVDRMTQFVPILAVMMNVAFYDEIPLLSSDSRALFWVIWVIFVRIPTLFMMDKSIEMLRVFNTKCTKDKLSFSAAIWDGLVFEMAAMPLGILALIEGTYQGLNAALFNLDITFWNASAVRQSEVESKYRAMVDTPSKCSFQYLRNIAAFMDVRARSFYVASRSPRMAVTAYVSFMLFANAALICYIWYMTTDRTLLFCSFLSFFFNCFVFSSPWKRLVKPLRIFWSYDYNFEYYFLPLTIALILFIGKNVFIFKETYNYIKDKQE